jgi:hypothetical protein
VIPSITHNAIIDELKAVIVAGGLIPSELTLTQLRDALNATYARLNNAPFTVSPTAPTPGPLDSSGKLATTSGVNAVGPVVGTARNAKMSLLTAPNATATFTADEVIVETALGGAPIRLAGVNLNINLGIVGAGGMAAGAAPNSGYVAIYLAYNPTTLAKCLFAVDASTAIQANIYGGVNAPAGFVASALVAVWPTTAAGLLAVGSLEGRTFSFPAIAVQSTSATFATLTILVVAGALPKNAVYATGFVNMQSTIAANFGFGVAATNGGIGQTSSSGVITNPGQGTGGVFGLPIVIPQTVYFAFSCSGGTPTLTMSLSTYTF